MQIRFLVTFCSRVGRFVDEDAICPSSRTISSRSHVVNTPGLLNLETIYTLPFCFRTARVGKSGSKERSRACWRTTPKVSLIIGSARSCFAKFQPIYLFQICSLCWRTWFKKRSRACWRTRFGRRTWRFCPRRRTTLPSRCGPRCRPWTAKKWATAWCKPWSEWSLSCCMKSVCTIVLQQVVPSNRLKSLARKWCTRSVCLPGACESMVWIAVSGSLSLRHGSFSGVELDRRCAVRR